MYSVNLNIKQILLVNKNMIFLQSWFQKPIIGNRLKFTSVQNRIQIRSQRKNISTAY